MNEDPAILIGGITRDAEGVDFEHLSLWPSWPPLHVARREASFHLVALRAPERSTS